jgi:hypothetical protein
VPEEEQRLRKKKGKEPEAIDGDDLGQNKSQYYQAPGILYRFFITHQKSSLAGISNNAGSNKH